MILLAALSMFWLEIEPTGHGVGDDKRVVLIAADPEYRSEQAMPQLARIFARHGFQCTVLFAQDPAGTVNPTHTGLVPGLSKLENADLCVLMARFQHWADRDMRHFAKYVAAGKPLIALRTSTHAFAYPADSQSEFKSWSWDQPDGGFGRRVLGETWVAHWGRHGAEGTRATPVGDHPVLRGVGPIEVSTDAYEAHPPASAQVLLRGANMAGLAAGSPLVNDPKRGPMPVAWIPAVRARVLTTTMGSSRDLLDANFRRLLLNAAAWAVGRTANGKEDVGLVGDYRPSEWCFGKHRVGVPVADH
ncbi:MAG: ThuA domain-containing protein [Chthonomonas sp.]|nr:ThuA domain-containing protein [Chthonomonas sp.]